MELLSDNVLEYLNAIETYLPPEGKTNIADALRTMRQNQFVGARGTRSGVDKVALILTDGK